MVTQVSPSTSFTPDSTPRKKLLMHSLLRLGWRGKLNRSISLSGSSGA